MKRENRRTQRKPGKHHLRANRINHAAPRTAEEFFAQSRRFQDRWIRVTHAVSKMRSDRISLHRAAREYGLSPQTVRRLAGPALRKGSNGRYAAKRSDRLLRVVVIPSEQGLIEVATRDSRQASELGRYSEAVHKYLETGDASALQQFAGKYVLDLNGNQIALMTEPAQLDRFGGPEFSYESFYARSA
jgi:hypothetical protein